MLDLETNTMAGVCAHRASTADNEDSLLFVAAEHAADIF